MEYTKKKNINRGYMKLIVWQKSIELYKLAWKILLEAKIDYKIRSQIADATQSVSSNISEGYGRRSIREYIQFLYIALASLAEALTRMIALHAAQQISDEQFEEFDVLHYEIENRLIRLIEPLERKRDDGTWIDHISEDLEEYNA